jgi:hypothetical protein
MPSSVILCRDTLVRTEVSEEQFIRTVRRVLVTAKFVPSAPILVTLTIEAIRSSETSVLTRATGSNIPADGIPHRHRHENLKSYTRSLLIKH